MDYSHLSSTRGKRACWHAETNVVICTLPGDVDVFRPRPRKSLTFAIVTRGSGSMRRYLMDYPHLLSTRGKRARWHAETNVVICTLPGDVDVFRQRLRKSLTFAIVTRGFDSMWRYLMVIRTHNSAIVTWWSDSMRRYLMVIRTFVIQRQQVRWHMETTYGHPHPSYPKTIEVPFTIQRRTSLMISGMMMVVRF